MKPAPFRDPLYYDLHKYLLSIFITSIMTVRH